jgi:3-oxoadipate enol-lactonase
MKVIVNDILLNHTESGHPHGIPVVFIHGFPMNLTMWQDQLDKLPQADYRLIAYDIRGLGHSDLGNGEISIETHADDLMGLLDDLDIKKAIICGLSMGGYIALRAIEKYPDRFMGLVLCDTKSESDTEEGVQKRHDSIKKIKEEGVESFADGFLKNVLSDNTLQNTALVRQLKNRIMENSTEGIIAAQLAMAKRTDTTSVLKNVKVPTLIMVGEKDQVTPLKNAEILAMKIRNARLEIIKDAAHFSNVENSVDFNDVLVDFLTLFKKNSLE